MALTLLSKADQITFQTTVDGTTISISVSGAGDTIKTLIANIASGQYSDLTLTRVSGILYLYNNGVLVDSVASVNAISSGAVELARDAGTSGDLYKGIIDEFRISNVGTPSGEAKATYYSNNNTIWLVGLTSEILSVYPLPMQQNVPINTKITIVFSVDINPNTLNEQTISVSGLEWFITYDAGTRTATITPYGNLNPSTIYNITLSNKIKTSTNTPITPFSWWFVTEPPKINNNIHLTLWEKTETNRKD